MVKYSASCVLYATCICVRQLILLRKSDCLGCAVLLCLVVCLTLLASFFLPSLISHENMYTYMLLCLVCLLTLLASFFLPSLISRENMYMYILG